jgi:hypothetical protein
MTATITTESLITKADKLQARIERELRAAGLDPEMGDYDHPLNAEWLVLHEVIQLRLAA